MARSTGSSRQFPFVAELAIVGSPGREVGEPGTDHAGDDDPHDTG
jgi:hypothetical protein